MKKINLLIVLLLLIGGKSFAQDASLAGQVVFVDIEYILTQMPESKQIQKELSDFQTALTKRIEEKYKEYQAKLQEYQQFGATVAASIRQNTERELVQMQENIEQLQRDSEADLREKSSALWDPVQARVGKALSDVRSENNFALILSASIQGLDVVLAGDEKRDVSDLVLKKMGITPTPPAQGN